VPVATSRRPRSCRDIEPAVEAVQRCAQDPGRSLAELFREVATQWEVAHAGFGSGRPETLRRERHGRRTPSLDSSPFLR